MNKIDTPPLQIKIDKDTELRLLSEDDAQPLFELIEQNLLHLRTWLPWLDFTSSVEDERAFILRTRAQAAENKSFSFSIWYKGQAAGTIGYHEIDWMNRKVEIGYWLGAQFQGKGLMTRACKALVAYAFEELQLNKVEIRCATGNTRSCAIPQRLGFTREGVIRQAEWLYDHFVDLILYGLLASEWQREKT
ncbi:MAG TPA: GNAT family protein [Ktedonobacteraceae bacterium]|nr:GNAT family protein [Ktedonobacteraceae bacterium]